MCESFPTLSPKPDPPGWDSECPRFVCPKCDLLVVRRVDSIILDGFVRVPAGVWSSGLD